MNRYAALIRGIMPSDPNMRSAMLRGVFEGMGLHSVGSVLASGNIVFSGTETDVPALQSRIQRTLHAELGIGGLTIVRSRTELAAMVDSDPFAGLTHGRGTYLTATFLGDRDGGAPPEVPEALSGAVRVVGYDAAAAAILTVVDNTVTGSPNHMAWLESVYGKHITTRTWLTVQKVLAKL